jgi:hypothetical protein
MHFLASVKIERLHPYLSSATNRTAGHFFVFVECSVEDCSGFRRGVDAELISASTSACMTAEATPGATRTGFRYALVSTTRHPDIDEPALAIPNRIDDRAGTRHSTGRPVLEPVDGASC